VDRLHLRPSEPRSNPRPLACASRPPREDRDLVRPRTDPAVAAEVVEPRSQRLRSAAINQSVNAGCLRDVILVLQRTERCLYSSNNVAPTSSRPSSFMLRADPWRNRFSTASQHLAATFCWVEHNAITGRTETGGKAQQRRSQYRAVRTHSRSAHWPTRPSYRSDSIARPDARDGAVGHPDFK
jgi:hypothetical protein